MSTDFKILFVILLAILSSVHASSQEIIDGMVAYNYNTEDGLPNNQVLFSMQDSKGYMWFGTGGGGAVRYDGANFEVFDISKGLHDNEVYQIFEDHKGRIWFGTANLRFSYLEDDVLKSYKFNAIIKQNLKIGAKIRGLHIDEEDTVYIFFTNSCTATISKDGVFNQRKIEGHGFEVYLFPDNVVKCSRNNVRVDGIKSLTNFHIAENHVFVDQHGRTKEFTKNFLKTTLFNGRNFLNRTSVINYEEVIYLFRGKTIYSYSPELEALGEIKNFDAIGEHGIVNVYVRNNKIWVLTFSSGIFIGTIKQNEFILERNIFEDELITTMTTDGNDGIWLTSHTRGIYYIPYPENKTRERFENWILYPKVIEALSEEEIITSLQPSELNLLKSGSPDSTIIKLKHNSHINSLVQSDKTDSIYFIDYRNLYITHPSLKTVKVIGPTATGKIMSLGENEQLIIENSGKFITYKDGHFTETINRLTNIINDLVYKDGIPYIGTADGLLQLNFRNDSVFYSKTEKDTKETLLNAHIMDLEPYKNGLWLAAQGIGLGFYTDSLQFQLSEADGLHSSQIISLTQESDTLWVATHSGLNKLVFDDQFKLVQNKLYDKNNGLSSNTVTGLECTKSFLYVSGKAGLDIIPRNNIDSHVSDVSFKISDLKSMGKITSPKNDQVVLKHSENDISIDIEAVQFNAVGHHQFRYRLLPEDDHWKYTKDHHLEIANLIPEKYTFQVEIKNNQGKWVERDEIKFEITPPFWKRLWFLALMFITVLGFIYLIFKSRESAYRKKIAIENNMNLLRGKALRAQVNPHFIFNTLNSIQSFVLEGDYENSNKFITYFSKLIRKILHQSNKDLVTLVEEIDLLKMYLVIEQMRYGNSFTFNIDIDSHINLEHTKIPPMLIQPYVENAIWHGLADHTKDGHVNISFKTKESHQLECVVLDNGIGRIAAKELKNATSNRKSVGIRLSNDRLKALNNSQFDHVKIEDLTKKSGEAEGTKVTITIPYKNNE